MKACMNCKHHIEYCDDIFDDEGNWIEGEKVYEGCACALDSADHIEHFDHYGTEQGESCKNWSPDI